MCSLQKRLMSRKLRHWPENMICASIKETQCESPTTSATIQGAASVSDAEDTVGDGPNFNGQHLLPVSTIQNIVEEIQNIYELGQTYTLN